MNRFILISLLILLEMFHCNASTSANIFSMDNYGLDGDANGKQNEKKDEIPIFLKADKLIQKRREEARKLITEGQKMIKQGEKKNNKSLITKGQIKKEIGQKQLEVLKEQTKIREQENNGSAWQ